jgi:hypothetical protein
MVASRKIAEEVIAVCRQAAAASLSAKVRCGNVLRITPDDADDVLLTADLHGDRRNFRKVVQAADLENHPRRHLIVQEVCHGGPMYPAGNGCMSHLLLEDVARLKAEYPERVHFLMGNHELAELTDYPISKGGRLLNLLFRAGINELYGPCADRVREAYMEFIRALPLAAWLGDGVFACHSIPETVDRKPFDREVFSRDLRGCDMIDGGELFRLVWGRDYRPENADAFANLIGAEVLVTGHEPCADGLQVPNPRQVIIDTCSANPRYLLMPLSSNGPVTQGRVLECVQRLD